MAGSPTFALHISLTVSPKSVYLNLAELLLFKVMMLRCLQLVVEVLPAFFGLGGGLGAVHPHEGGGLVRRQAVFGADGVELPHLRGHRVQVIVGDEQLPQAMLGGQAHGGRGRERRFDLPGELPGRSKRRSRPRPPSAWPPSMAWGSCSSPTMTWTR